MEIILYILEKLIFPLSIALIAPYIIRYIDNKHNDK